MLLKSDSVIVIWSTDRSRCFIADTLDLTTEDVGCQIELVYTPVRSDGVTGIPQRIVSDVVKDGIADFLIFIHNMLVILMHLCFS